MNLRISILMSVFNETEQFIHEAVESILSQTLKDFELIVVNDNPDRTNIKQLFDAYQDSRIRFFQNKKNMGLAMCMNKAAAEAWGDILVRMDADDISEQDRLAVEYELLESSNCDFVFSAYSCIDETSSPLNHIDSIKTDITGDVLSRIVALNPTIIHHPTVMMRRSVFEAAGGYRDFPCAQDADLWLRLQEQGCRFYRSSRPLLRYRVNAQSVSRRKWFLQRLTWYYIFNLGMERLATGTDSFSPKHYQQYLQKYGLGNAKAESQLRRGYNLLGRARSCGRIKATFLRLAAFASHPLLRQYYIQKFKKESMLKRSAGIKA